MIVKDLLKLGKDQLATKNIAPVEAELLLAHALGVNRMELHGRVIELTDEQAIETSEIYNQAIAERLTGKPAQYIIGSAPFRYLEYEVGAGVLIPRPETESLVDEVLHQLNTFADPVSLVDLGSGSGAIAISIASETAGKKIVHVVAVEKSSEAIAWLQKNIAKHDVNVRVVQGDVSDALEGVKCDVVVANPPYLPDGAQIPQELNFEPAEALFGGPANGMSTPNQFIAAAARLLKPGGLFAIEHNELQGPLIASELTANFETIALHKDLTDRPRFTTARRK
ncbi:MAG: peptide chain release factor N(5)-glutamine methyltransferase [Actinobacteria bacterium]|uniref:peptide chain release factor N(5)-glutamine methyltransferase n=1 Tax=freshwater metagenome TaxID=449393 RepID=A0A6J6Q7N1_9ZZZZ|nr:peptide chain release factor N(5)-glutamine methyltransferase [Actinomycetota bacterium]